MGLGYTKSATRSVVEMFPCWSPRTSASTRSTVVTITHTNAKGKLYYLHQGTTKKGKTIVIYTPHQSVEEFAQLLKGLNPFIAEAKVREYFARSVQYSPMLQFLLEDEKRRLFTAQRYCFRGSVDDWIDIGYGPLTTLVKQYVKHLGQESYFELY